MPANYGGNPNLFIAMIGFWILFVVISWMSFEKKATGEYLISFTDCPAQRTHTPESVLSRRPEA